MKQHFFINDQYFGSCDRGLERTKEQLHVPRSYVYICPECGNAWARAAVDSPDTRWTPIPSKCEACGGGSLHSAWNQEYNEAWPAPVLARELLGVLDSAGFDPFYLSLEQRRYLEEKMRERHNHPAPGSRG